LSIGPGATCVSLARLHEELAEKTVEMVRAAFACGGVATPAIERRAHTALHGLDDCLVFQFNLMQCASGALAQFRLVPHVRTELDARAVDRLRNNVVERQAPRIAI